MKKQFTNVLFCAGLIGQAFAQPLMTGPSTTTTPYLWPTVANASVMSVITVGDVIGTYTFCGIPDGMGIVDNGGTTFTLVMNHEFVSNAGAVRAHGQSGAFVSKLVLNKSNLQVLSASDLIQNVKLWAGNTYSLYNASNTSTLCNFSRFCSADLAKPSAFYNSVTGKGTSARIFMNGEEGGIEGRAFAHLVTGAEAGTSYELPLLGKNNIENCLASPYEQDKTVVCITDDSSPSGQVYFYVGNKTTTGTDVDKAGLTNGRLYGVSVLGYFNEVSSPIVASGTKFNLIDLGTVQNMTGATLNTNGTNLGVTNFLRPEDGVWDPNRPSDFYFNTTNSFTGPSRLWRLRFTDITNPELGGTITCVLNGTEGQKMLDNMGIDNNGNVLLQEDPGGNNYRAKIYNYRIQTGVLTTVLDQDSTRFQTGGANFLTIDEETSGIIDIQAQKGPGWFLIAHQAHYSLPSPMIEGGQLIAFYNPISAAANPEINLTGNSQSIASGNTAISSSNNTSFGSVNIGTSTSRTFVIQNTTTGTLIVSGMNMSGTNAGDFTISGPTTPFYIGANGSQTITVFFNAPVSGARNATLNIMNSDFDEGAYSFAVQGTGAMPEINVTGNSQSIPSGNTAITTGDNTNFGGIYLGNNASQNFVIQNTGTGTLSISNLSIGGTNSNEFVVVSPTVWPSVILPSATLNLNIVFTPLALGNRNAQVMIYNNDSDEALYTYAIQGSGMTDVGIKSYSADQDFAIVFPNPSNEEASVSINGDLGNVSVSVKNLLGQTKMELNDAGKQGNEIKLQTSQWPSGTYFVTVRNNSHVQNIKLVVAH